MDGLSSRQTRSVRFALLALSSLVITACASYPGNITRDALTAEDLAELDNKALGQHWDTLEQPRAVAVLVHGLNLEPQAMTDIATALHVSGMDVLSISLGGHTPELSEEGRLLQFRHADFSSWQQEVGQATRLAYEHARDLGIPLYTVGFSLGGLLSADYLQRGAAGDGVEVSRMVLFAPAISLKWSSYLLYPLQIFPGILLPSMAPESYRANDFAPASAYLTLYEGMREFNAAAGPQLNIPVLVFMHPRDELVSASGLKEFIETRALSEWCYVEVQKSEGAADVLDHLILSEDSLGAEAWKVVSARMLDFLR